MNPDFLFYLEYPFHSAYLEMFDTSIARVNDVELADKETATQMARNFDSYNKFRMYFSLGEYRLIGKLCFPLFYFWNTRALSVINP